MDEWLKQKIEDIKVATRKICNKYDAITESEAMAILAAEYVEGVEMLYRHLQRLGWTLTDDFHVKDNERVNWLDKNAIAQKSKEIEEILRVSDHTRLAKDLAKTIKAAEKDKYEINCNIQAICKELQEDRDGVANNTIRELIEEIEDSINSSNSQKW